MRERQRQQLQQQHLRLHDWPLRLHDRPLRTLREMLWRRAACAAV